MTDTRTETNWPEIVCRIIAEAIPPLLASGHVSRSAGLWLAAVFLFMLVLAAASECVNSERPGGAHPSPRRLESDSTPLADHKRLTTASDGLQRR